METPIKTKDLAGTFNHMLKAAEQGDVPAQSAVAMMYADGKGVQQTTPRQGSGGSRRRRAATSLPPGTPGTFTGTAKVWTGTRPSQTNGQKSLASLCRLRGPPRRRPRLRPSARNIWRLGI